jgi:serine/threonine protein kinase
MRSTAKVGAPQWSAPEVFQKSNNIDYEKADIWSMGVIMWEMV